MRKCPSLGATYRQYVGATQYVRDRCGLTSAASLPEALRAQCLLAKRRFKEPRPNPAFELFVLLPEAAGQGTVA
jgi:hypothetical protein